MATEKFLGGSWAATHGPSEPQALLTWLLDLGFRGLTAGPVPRAVDWRGVRAALRDLPAAVPAVWVESALELPRAEAGSLASRHAGERAAAMARIGDAIALARRVGCPRLVLDPGVVRVAGEAGPEDLGDPAAGWTADRAAAQLARRNAGRDAALDAVCRGLFALLREHPDIEFCLTPSRHVFGLGDPDGLAAVLEDLGQRRLHYWHDTAVAAIRAELLGTDQGVWLERFSKYLIGMTLGDSAEGRIYRPPGAGGVDYPLLASYRRRFGRPLPLVVELELGVPPAEIPGVHAFLSKYGL